MKKKHLFHLSLIVPTISCITLQVFYLILIQPHTTYAQSRVCEYLTPIGVKRFTREEQRRHGFNSGQNLLCYARVQNCQSTTPGSDAIPRTSSLVMCDTGVCTFHNECMCPRDPMECFRDAIDGRSRYRNRQRLVRVDDNISCQRTSPIRAKIFSREEQRHYGFNSNDRHLCYANVQNCRMNNTPVNTSIVICDTARYACSVGTSEGVTCPCPTNINECAKDTIDNHSAYLGSTEMVQADEQPSNPNPQSRPRGGGGRPR